MKLSNYLIHLAMDKNVVVDDRILYLYDSQYNVYFTKVIHSSPNDQCYVFFESDEPFHDYDKIDVIKAWTVNDAVNCLMGISVLSDRYCESEV